MNKTTLLSTCALLVVFVAFSCSKSTQRSSNELTSTLNFYNWSYYIAENTIPDFENEFGVKVNYDNFSSNSEILAKFQLGATGYDLVVPSDYMVDIMIKLDMLEPLNFEHIPNFSNLDTQFTRLPFDSENTYSIPYQWGTTGIGINTRYIPEFDESWELLWDERYKGRISVLDDMRSGLVPALKLLGFSVNTTDEEELMLAKERMFKQKELVRTYSSETYMDLLKSGDIWIAQGWSGDIYQVTKENPDVVFIIPKEGSYIWVDNLVIPKGSRNKRTAEAFINYVLRPEVSSDISNYTGYSSPNKAAIPFINEEFKNNHTMYPDSQTMQRLEFMTDVGNATRLYNQIWNEIKSY
jgi:spermidine/putrescine-binding protein